MINAVDAEGWRAVLARCAALLARLGGEAWLTGGGVRDALLGRSPRDLDLAVTTDPWALARLLAPPGAPGTAVIPLRETHGTVRVVLRIENTDEPAQVDLAPLRGGSLHADLGARDFTINALAWPLAAYDAFVALLTARMPDSVSDTTALADPLGGLADLRARRLRAASETALADDPVRVVRGARLAAALDLTPDAATMTQLRAAAPALANEPVERVREELWGILALREAARAARGLALLRETSALGVVLAGLAVAPAHPESSDESGSDAALAHAVQTVAALDTARDAIAAHAPTGRQQDLGAWLDGWDSQPLAAGRPRRLALRWAALLHTLESGANGEQSGPIAAPPIVAPGIFKRMGMAKAERALTRTVARHLSLPARPLYEGAPGMPDADDLRAARRFFAATGAAGIETLLVAVACALAEVTPQPPLRRGEGEPQELGQAARWIARFAWARDTVVPPPLVDGPALITELGIAPGPEVGRLLAAIRQAQVEGAIARTDQALALARQLLGG